MALSKIQALHISEGKEHPSQARGNRLEDQDMDQQGPGIRQSGEEEDAEGNQREKGRGLSEEKGREKA